jgi:SAM-dependent methyltransferase
MKKLLNNQALERSSVVANSLMNRERGIVGGNSYTKELAFNPLNFLQTRLQNSESVSWLDLCCGTGKALIEAARFFYDNDLSSKVKIVGVDLAGMFNRQPIEIPTLQLIEASLTDWHPTGEFDLITCVHGLHYVGDKMELLRKTASWLKEGGLFLTNFDPTSLKYSDGKDAGKLLIKSLRKIGFQYQAGKHLLICEGKKVMNLSLTYLGADDQAGPNYTGQPAVTSYYVMGEKTARQKSTGDKCED